MNGNEHLVRQLGRQRAQNAYYRDCYALFKSLQDLTEQTSNDLRSIYKSDGDHSTYSIHQILWHFQNKAAVLIDQACEAQAACDELCPVDLVFSARDVLEPIKRLYNNPNAASLGRHAIKDNKDQIDSRLKRTNRND